MNGIATGSPIVQMLQCSLDMLGIQMKAAEDQAFHPSQYWTPMWTQVGLNYFQQLVDPSHFTYSLLVKDYCLSLFFFFVLFVLGTLREYLF